MISNSGKSRTGLHQNKCFLLETSRLADSLLMVTLLGIGRAKADLRIAEHYKAEWMGMKWPE